MIQTLTTPLPIAEGAMLKYIDGNIVMKYATTVLSYEWCYLYIALTPDISFAVNQLDIYCLGLENFTKML